VHRSGSGGDAEGLSILGSTYRPWSEARNERYPDTSFSWPKAAFVSYGHLYLKGLPELSR